MLNTVWFAAFAVCWVKGAAKRLALWQYTKINVAAIVDSKLTQCMAIVGFSLVIQHTHTAIWIETRRINRVVLVHIWKMSTRLAQSKQMPRRFPLFHACSSNNVYRCFFSFLLLHTRNIVLRGNYHSKRKNCSHNWFETKPNEWYKTQIKQNNNSRKKTAQN